MIVSMDASKLNDVFAETQVVGSESNPQNDEYDEEDEDECA